MGVLLNASSSAAPISEVANARCKARRLRRGSYVSEVREPFQHALPLV